MKKLAFSICILLLSTTVFAQNLSDPELTKDLNLVSINSDTPQLYDLSERAKGRVVWIEFWEHWCGPCILAMPHLQELKDEYGDDLQIICVSGDD